MVSPAQMRKIVATLPETEEKSHFDHPDFRVGNKIFAGLTADEKRATLKLTPESQALLMSARPEAFQPAAGAWGRSGWTYVVLSQVQTAELRELLVEAFGLVAPKRLATAHATANAKPKIAKRPRSRR